MELESNPSATLRTGVLYYGDNLDVLRRHIPDESIDLIYLDPPFNSNRSYNVLFRESTGAGSEAQIEAFEDTWHWGPAAQATYEEIVTGPHQNVARLLKAMVEGLGHNEVTAYLTMMAIRLIELQGVLKPTGSVYLHCDPTTGHYLKVLMDSVFGPRMFLGEIIWRRTASHIATRRWPRLHDTLLHYAKDAQQVFFDAPRAQPDEEWVEREYRHEDERGRYMLDNLTGAGVTGGASGQPWRGVDPARIGAGRHWRFHPDKLDQLDAEGRIYWPKRGRYPKLKQYLHETGGAPVADIWTDISVIGRTAAERLGYPTQKPIALLERIILASSKPGDVVLDPFCGCGTAQHAAQKHRRRWVGIDITHLAIGRIRRRMQDAFPGIDIKVIGEPVDLAGAQELAATRPQQFEFWVVDRLDGIPTGGKGPDLDGVLPFIEFGGTAKKGVISVKGTKNVSPEMIRELRGAINDDKPFGVLVTLTSATRGMVTQAAAAGFYESAGRKYPRIQLLTVEEMLHGKRPEMPPQRSPFAEAPLEREQAQTERLL